MWLANLAYKDKEQVAYMSIECLMELKKWLDTTLVNYKKYITDLEKEKEEKKDITSAQKKKEEKVILELKRKYKI